MSWGSNWGSWGSAAWGSGDGGGGSGGWGDGGGGGGGGWQPQGDSSSSTASQADIFLDAVKKAVREALAGDSSAGHLFVQCVYICCQAAGDETLDIHFRNP